MLKSIIHAGGESTRLRDVFNGPKALVPIGDKTLLWFHLKPLVKSKIVMEYVFTLRHQHELVQDHIEELKKELNISCSSIVEPRPLGRAGVIRLGIEKGLIDTESSYLMSHPDDFVPVNIKDLVDYASDAEKKGKSMVMVMARYITNPFGVGIVKKEGDIIELKHFQEKPELPLIENHYASTGTILFLPEAMKEFKKVPLDKLTHPEHEIVPRLAKQNKVAVFLVDRWISVNYASDYENVSKMGKEKLLKFLDV